ncbi:MAG TPA: type II secretion system F family protein [Thermodesulfobacteriota bacterium]|nr:type II secretion system F family protein [Thermodesulfobacteriota bacterium]
MPTFKYRVRDRLGKAMTGTIEAPSVEVAGTDLYQKGYFPIAVEEESVSVSINLSDLWKRFKKVKPEEIILFSQQLSTLYKAGLPLLSGLKGLRDQIMNQRLKEILEEIGLQVEGGNTLFGAMSKHPDVFSVVYLNMIRAGETSGRLGESLDRYVALADRELRSRQKVKEATRYPKIVVFSVIIAFIVLLAFVIPRFAQVYAQFNTTLPLPTRIMIGTNNLFHHYWYLILPEFLLIPILVRRYIRTEKGRVFWDRLKTRIPGFGRLFVIAALSRFAHTFVMLNKSGIPILQTLEVTSTTINNVVISQSIEEISRQVREGRTLADSMKETGRFTPLVIQMVGVGETTGTLDEMLIRITEYYDIELENAIKKMTTYIEPALTLFMGVVVLFLALAVFLPWWNMAKLFR